MNRGRIVVGTLGLDQHEVGAMAVARLLMRNGFEVVYLGRFNTPATLAAAAEQEGAEVVGVSVHSWELVAYVDDLVAACHAAGAAVAVGGSVLTEGDRADLAGRGVDAVFGPYAAEDDIVAALDGLVARGRSGDGPAAAAAAAADEAGAGPGSLAGRVVAVTGAARGLGRAYAAALAAEGAAVVANDVDADALAEAATGGHPVAADVSEEAGARAIVRGALERYGRLDAVVSNAGLLRSGPILRLDPADVDAVLAVHVRGTFLLARAAGAHWRTEAKAGRPVEAALVTTTSAAGLYGFRGEALYSAAKAAVAAFTLVAADELGRYGATANAVAPAARTRMTAWMGEPPPGGPATDPLAPEHVAPLICWLVGPGAREVTGRVFEAGVGTLALADGWRQAGRVALPPLAGPAEAGRLASGLLARGPEPRPVLRPELPADLAG